MMVSDSVSLLEKLTFTPLKWGNLHPLGINILGIKCCDIDQALSTVIRWNFPHILSYSYLLLKLLSPSTFMQILKEALRNHPSAAGGIPLP